MVSGKYSAVAGAVSREQSIANISNNLANATTTGYKRSIVSFESLLRGVKQTREAKGINYNRIGNITTDFSPGPIKTTDNPLDLAINGEGFFKVQGPDSVLYTKRGDFTIDAEGVLRANNGMAVLDDANQEITIPNTDTSQISINSLGTISIINTTGTRAEVAQLGIVSFDNLQALQREEDTTYSVEAGVEEIPNEQPNIIQGSQELSNINMVEEMAHMINDNRTYAAYHNVLKSYSTIGQKQDDLGTVS